MLRCSIECIITQAAVHGFIFFDHVRIGDSVRLDSSWIDTAKRLESDLAQYRKRKARHPNGNKLAETKAKLDRRYAQMAAFALGLPDAMISFDCDLESISEQWVGADGLVSVFGPSALSSIPPHLSAELIDYAEKLTERSICVESDYGSEDHAEKQEQAASESQMLVDRLLHKYNDKIVSRGNLFPDAERRRNNTELFSICGSADAVKTIRQSIGCRIRIDAAQSKYDLNIRRAADLPGYLYIK